MRAFFFFVSTAWLGAPVATLASRGLGEEGTDVNIHKTFARGGAAAIEVNDYLNSLCPSDDVFLNSTNEPHITLYLTDFVGDAVACDTDGNTVCDALGALAPTLEPASLCEANPVTLGSIEVSGCYAMWKATSPAFNPCRTGLSVRHMSLPCPINRFRVRSPFICPKLHASQGDIPPPPPIRLGAGPSEPTKSEREALIKRFGSQTSLRR